MIIKIILMLLSLFLFIITARKAIKYAFEDDFKFYIYILLWCICLGFIIFFICLIILPLIIN